MIIAAARPPVAAVIDLDVPSIDGWLLTESLCDAFGGGFASFGVRYAPSETGSPNQVTQALRQLLAHEPVGQDAESHL